MRKKKNLIWMVSIVIVICAAVMILPWKTNVKREIEAVQWKIGDSDYTENVLVTVKGTYNNYLLRADTFKGSISVECYDFTYNNEMAELKFSDGIGNILYFNFIDGKPEIYSLGFLICTSDFSEFLIGVNYPAGWDSGDGINICGYAEDRTEAVKIAQKLALNSEWLSPAAEDFR